MFQYTHEVIFNSLTMKDGSNRIARGKEGNNGSLIIKRGGEYWKNFVQDQKVYKTVGNVGVYELLKIDVEKFADVFPAREDETSFMAAGTYQLSLFVKLLDPHALYEFGYPNYKSFGRHILVGFDVLPGEDEEAVAAKVHESLALAIRKEEFVVGALDGTSVKPFEDGTDTVVAIRANHFALRFDSAGLALYDETVCDSCVGEYLPTIDIQHNTTTSKNAAAVVTPGVEPFATGEWLIENLRFPTYPNIRWAAVGEEDRPVPSELYVQFSFAYDSPRPQFGGISGVGQKVEAVTRHIYYVRQADAAAFQQALEQFGLTVVETNNIEVTDPDTNAVSDGQQSGGQQINPAG